MTDNTSAALEWLRDMATKKHRKWALKENARAILAHIAALKARATAAEAEVRDMRQAGSAVSARGETTPLDLREWRPFELSQAIQRIGLRAEAAEAREAALREALEKIDGAVSAGITETDGPARVKADGDTRIEDGFIVGQFAIQFELIMKCVQNVCRQALAASAPAAPESRESRESRVAKLERLLREARADVEYIADAESGSAEGAASRDLLADIDAALEGSHD